MQAYVARRLLLLVPVLLGMSILIFLAVRLLPGDVAQVMLADQASADRLARLRQELGLNRPWHVQYAQWVAGLATGDWGRSLRTQFRVRELIGQKIPATIELALASLLIAGLIGIPLGALAGAFRDSWLDHALSTAFTFGVSIPGFVLGTLLILGCAVRVQWLPSSGYVPFTEDSRKNLAYLFLPALSLSLNGLCTVARMARAGLVETEQAAYVRFAQAKGLPPSLIFCRHRLPAALGPVVSLLGMQAGYLLGGTVLIETLFDWPGIGKLLVGSIFERDYPVVQMVVLLDCAVFLVANPLAEVAAAALDPRVRYR